MQIIRSLLYNIYLFIWTFGFGILFIPLALLSLKGGWWVKRTWAKGLIVGLRFICGVKMRVVGLENIPPAPAIIACKHQSAWETIVLLYLIPRPIYILKRVLEWVPIFGYYIMFGGTIAIDRKAGSKAIKQIVTKIKERLTEDRYIVVFPEGTRVEPGKTGKYQSGIAAIYKEANIPVVPVAVNSGMFWRKNAFRKYPGTITIEFLPALPAGMDRKEFMKLLKEKIEDGSNRLLGEK